MWFLKERGKECVLFLFANLWDSFVLVLILSPRRLPTRPPTSSPSFPPFLSLIAFKQCFLQAGVLGFSVFEDFFVGPFPACVCVFMCAFSSFTQCKTLHQGLEKPSAFILSPLNMCSRMKSVQSVYGYLEICLASTGRCDAQASSSDGPRCAKLMPGPQLGQASPHRDPALLSLSEGTLKPGEQTTVCNTHPPSPPPTTLAEGLDHAQFHKPRNCHSYWRQILSLEPSSAWPFSSKLPPRNLRRP